MTLKWTRTPPTEAGWYFLRCTAIGGEKSVTIVYMKHGEAMGCNSFTEWSGPIPPPEEPS